MALLKRMSNAAAYLRWLRVKAVFGLLTSEERHRWIQTVGSPRLGDIELNAVYPWFAFQSIRYIEKLLRPDMKIIEYGGGYSTLWWASRVSEVTTVERSKEWSKEIKLSLRKHDLKNVELRTFDKFPNTSEGELELNYESLRPLVDEYISSPLEPKHSCDVLIVDDVFRNAVVEGGLQFLKPGGLLILDDSERERHKPVMESMIRGGWSSAHFFGAVPYHFHEKQTTIWFKPAEQTGASGLER